MRFSYASNAVLSKARAMYGKRLTEKNYSDLINCGTVSEIAAYLRNNTTYSSVLVGLNDGEIHRGQLESLIRQKIFYDFAALGKYDLSVGEHFFGYIISRAEIYQIMHSLMLLVAGRSEEYIYTMPMGLDKHTHIDLAKLAHIKNYDDFLDAIKRSPYYNLLKPYRVQQNKDIDIVRIESILYNGLYNNLFELIDKYTKGKAKEELKDAMGSYVDVNNFIMIFRLKKYYNSDNKYIRSLLLPQGLLSKKHIESMLNAADADEVMNVMRSTNLGKKFLNLEYNYIDELASKFKFIKHQHNIRYSVNPPVVMISYIFLKELEISNITSIIEGIKYNVPKEDIWKLIICTKTTQKR